MFDIGWPELLVVAIVLIVVVGPKDLPPMLRAFGRTTKKLRAMASEFRGQFDDALREAELDDVKKTFDDARKLNPMQNLRDAVNPLKDTAKDIKSDLEKSVKTPSSSADVPPAKMAAPEPTMKLADGPPEFKTEPAAAKAAGATEKSGANSAAPAKKPAAKSTAAKTTRPAASTKAKTTTAKKAVPAKAAGTKSTASNTGVKSTTSASRAKAPDKTAAAKPAPRARKPKQGEDQA